MHISADLYQRNLTERSFLFYDKLMVQKSSKLEWFSIGDAAKYLGVSKDTLRRWERRGKFKSYRTPGGRRRYTMYDLELAIKPQKAPAFFAQTQPEPKIKEITIKPELPTPEIAPKVTQPQRRLSTTTVILLAAILALLALLTFSGLGNLLLSRLKPPPGILNPMPQSYLL